MYYNQNKLFNRNSFIGSNFQFNSPIKLENSIDFYKKGHKIHIKKENRGKFTDYCGGKVTNACIQKGKNSPDPKIRKRATFAANARTWKHQLGGVIKFLQKISPKLVSKTKGRLLTSYFKPVKDFKTPYIFPGQLGWSPAETRTVWHRTNNPNFKIKRKFKGRWDAEEHGAPENGLWVSEKKDIGFMNDRPILVQLQQALKKPIVQIGDIPTQGKNNMRNYILKEAEQSGADAVKFQGIKDNKTSNQNVTFIFEPTISAVLNPKMQNKVIRPSTKPNLYWVFRGGPYNKNDYMYFTSDPNYAKQYGKVKRYIIASRNPTKIKDPFIQHDMEQIHFYNSNTNPDMLIGHDLKTNDVIPSKGTEYVIWNPKQIINNG